jgi:hypothetical protein
VRILAESTLGVQPVGSNVTEVAAMSALQQHGPTIDSHLVPRIGSGPPVDAADIVEVVLEGGPSDLPADLRALCTSVTALKIKVRYGRGYEHFERVAALPDGDALRVVFRWSGRTRMAE